MFVASLTGKRTAKTAVSYSSQLTNSRCSGTAGNALTGCVVRGDDNTNSQSEISKHSLAKECTIPLLTRTFSDAVTGALALEARGMH